MGYRIEQDLRLMRECLDGVIPDHYEQVPYLRWSINAGTLNIPDSCMLSLAEKLWRVAERSEMGVGFVGVVCYERKNSRLNRKWDYWHLYRHERKFDLIGEARNAVIEMPNALGYYTFYAPRNAPELAALADFSLKRAGVFILFSTWRAKYHIDVASDLLERKIFKTLNVDASQITSQLIDSLMMAGFCVVNATGGFDSGGVHLNLWNCRMIEI